MEKKIFVIDKTKEGNPDHIDMIETTVQEKENVMNDESLDVSVDEPVEALQKVKKVKAKAFILESLKSGEKTVEALSQEYLDAGHSRVSDPQRCKASLAVTVSHLHKTGSIVRVSRGTYKLS